MCGCVEEPSSDELICFGFCIQLCMKRVGYLGCWIWVSRVFCFANFLVMVVVVVANGIEGEKS